MRKERLVVLLLGPPGSGKGTQAALLAERYRVPHLSLGAMLRDSVAKGEPDGLAIAPLLAAGSPVPVATMESLFRRRVAAPDAQNGFVGDGLTRTVDQAKALDEILSGLAMPLRSVIYLEATDEELRKRLLNRLVCPVCGANYTVGRRDGPRQSKCPNDGAALAQRADDYAALIDQRITGHRGLCGPLMIHYQQIGLLHCLDAAQPIRALHEEIMALVEHGTRPENRAAIADSQ